MPAAVLIVILLLTGCQHASGPPYPAEESIARMAVEDGFRVEKLLTEPLVVSPVAMDVDENGRFWIVEDRGYPLNVEGKVGRIKLIEDTDGDGVPDKATIFADRLTMPTGILRWKKGVLVTDAPDVLYLEDTDGDGRADVKRVILTGFPFTNPQHTVNGLFLGLDNWIYLAHENPTTAIVFKDKFGDRGTDIRYPERPDLPPLKERGRNIRFRPDTWELEALSGASQFGLGFDDWGHIFTLNNTYHARHEVIAARYLKRNPDLPIPTAMEEMSDHGSPANVFPLVARQRIEMLTNVGQFTSACGLTLYRGGSLPASFLNSALVAEPAHNLVHRDIYEPKGSTFVAHRAKPASEFIASSDPWFRPVNFYTAPDGTLYLIDYYRLVIEHPEWMAAGAQREKELYAGNDRGRIYRIAAAGAPRPARLPRLGAATTAELVAQLANPNPWWRRTAQRLLMDRKPSDAESALRALLAASPSGVARVHALWVLEGFGRLTAADIERGMNDPVAGVRENSIVLAEPRLIRERALTTRLLQLKDDPDPRVRFQLLSTLGSLNAPEAAAAREALLFRDLEDRWVQTAALTVSSEEGMRLFQRAAAALSDQESPGRVSFFRQSAAVVGSRKRSNEIQTVLEAIHRRGPATWWKAAALEGLAAGLRGTARTPPPPTVALSAGEPLLLEWFQGEDAGLRRAALRVLENLRLSGAPAVRVALDRAARTSVDPAAGAEVRADALGLLMLAQPESRRPLFEKLVDPRQPEFVAGAAARGLGRIPGEATGRFLIQHWREMTPAVRMEAADAIYRDPERLPMMVTALKNGDIQPWTLAFRHKAALIMHRDPALRDAARPLLEKGDAEREKVVQQYLPALEMKADPDRGKVVFENICAKCHKLKGAGSDVGPDLATMRSQPKSALLAAVLNPSQSISQGYEAYVVETNSGATLDGVLGPQTPTTITLRHEEGKQDVIQRSNIKSMYVTNLSAMPGDLEKQIDPQKMADLLEYLKR